MGPQEKGQDTGAIAGQGDSQRNSNANDAPARSKRQTTATTTSTPTCSLARQVQLQLPLTLCERSAPAAAMAICLPTATHTHAHATLAVALSTADCAYTARLAIVRCSRMSCVRSCMRTGSACTACAASGRDHRTNDQDESARAGGGCKQHRRVRAGQGRTQPTPQQSDARTSTQQATATPHHKRCRAAIAAVAHLLLAQPL